MFVFCCYLEYKVQALNPIGNYLGGCYLKLSRDDISIFDHKKAFIGVCVCVCVCVCVK